MKKKVKLTCAVKSGCNRIQKRILLNHKSFSIRHIPNCRKYQKNLIKNHKHMDKVKTGIVYTTIKTCRCIQSLFSDKPRVPRRLPHHCGNECGEIQCFCQRVVKLIT